MDAIVWDIDGVLVDSFLRANLYIDHQARSRCDWETFFRSIVQYAKHHHLDKPLDSGIDLYRRLMTGNITPFFVTMRQELERSHTFEQLQSWVYADVSHSQLLMNGVDPIDENGRYTGGQVVPDLGLYKLTRFKEIEDQGYKILYAIDDYPDICFRYTEAGYPSLCFRVPQGKS